MKKIIRKLLDDWRLSTLALPNNSIEIICYSKHDSSDRIYLKPHFLTNKSNNIYYITLCVIIIVGLFVTMR